ncbi:MYL6 [Cordylochernes scorpioides]|uniref:MYL6 n=1 Tax=Cordylochernes scorpioides TaxID=51811 RepID=A0ABY6KL23_9ARAC|nr:MYL6 [Cordylochernes scorpioides]
MAAFIPSSVASSMLLHKLRGVVVPTEFQDAFSLFDNRGDNKIAISQLGDVLRALGQNPTEAEVKKCCIQLKPATVRSWCWLVVTLTVDGVEERISFEVFLPILHTVSRNRSTDTAEDFIEGLRHFDKDGNGYISSAELRHLLTTLGEKLTDDEVEQLLAGQEDSQGNVHYEGEYFALHLTGSHLILKLQWYVR